MKRRRSLMLLPVIVLACVACGVWLRVQQQHYAFNRQLIAALESNNFQQALALVNAGADPNTRQTLSPTPSLKFLFSQLLHRSPPAANNSNTAFMLGCIILWKPPGDRSAPLVSGDQNLPLLKAMLAHGANVQARTLSNRTALHFAVHVERLPTVELLLQHGADVNAQSERGSTPLIYAASNHTADVVHLLLTHGANPNVQDADGNTALHHAYRSPIAKAFISELLGYGADSNLCNKHGVTPLQDAQKRHRADIVALLKPGGK